MQATRGAALEPQRSTGHRHRPFIVVAVAAFVLAADVISKIEVVAHLQPGVPVKVIGTFFELDLTRNPGAAFSIGTGDTWLFTAVALVVVGVIARTARDLASSGWAVALGLLLGGALGNLSDRLFRAPGPLRGHVVDWLQLPHWPIFNLADSSIVAGGILAALLAVSGKPLTRSELEAKSRPEDDVR